MVPTESGDEYVETVWQEFVFEEDIEGLVDFYVR
jgi:hypothetical protein